MIKSLLIQCVLCFGTKKEYEVDFGKLGKGVGFTQEGYNDTVSMYSIPYVYPPTGQRRFKVPELFNDWGEAPLNLTEKPNYCLQERIVKINSIYNLYIEDSSCLRTKV